MIQGPRISDANPELFKYFIRALCNANTSEGFQPNRDVSIPEVYLPSGKLGPPNMGQHPNNRTILAFFAGGAHGKIRKKLLKRWKNKDSSPAETCPLLKCICLLESLAHRIRPNTLITAQYY